MSISCTASYHKSFQVRYQRSPLVLQKIMWTYLGSSFWCADSWQLAVGWIVYPISTQHSAQMAVGLPAVRAQSWAARDVFCSDCSLADLWLEIWHAYNEKNNSAAPYRWEKISDTFISNSSTRSILNTTQDLKELAYSDILLQGFIYTCARTKPKLCNYYNNLRNNLYILIKHGNL